MACSATACMSLAPTHTLSFVSFFMSFFAAYAAKGAMEHRGEHGIFSPSLRSVLFSLRLSL